MITIIGSKTDLKSASAFLHDARFTFDAIDFNPQTQTFSLKLWVCAPRRKGGKDLQMWKAYLLSFAAVTDCKVKMHEKVSYYELATIRFVKREGCVHLVAHYGVEITLWIRELAGAIKETDESRQEWPNKSDSGCTD